MPEKVKKAIIADMMKQGKSKEAAEKSAYAIMNEEGLLHNKNYKGKK